MDSNKHQENNDQMTDLSEAGLQKNASQFTSDEIELSLEERPSQSIDRSQISSFSIELTAKEESIFNFLLEIVKENNLKTTLRVAGGWVRDKLCGKDNDDIDIALDDMYGQELAELISKKLYEIDVKEGKIEPKGAE